MKYTKYLFITSYLLLLLPKAVKCQVVSGLVKHANTQEVLSYVHIGVAGKNVGTITNDLGQFSLDLSSIQGHEKVLISMIGFETISLEKSALNVSQTLEVYLHPISYTVPEIEVVAGRGKEIKLGRHRRSKTTSGQSGVAEFGFGGEWGVKVLYPEESYFLNEISFHTRFNTVDSVLFRLNVYEVVDDRPGNSILLEPIYTTSYSGDKWISGNALAQSILIDDDIIVSFELVRIWYSEQGNNYLFYTHGKGYPEGRSFSRESSHDNWQVDQRAPLAIYISGITDY